MAGSGVTVSEELVITEEINNIDINLGVSTFEIRTGEEFRVVLNDVHEDTNTEVDNGTLRIREGRTRVRIFGGRNSTNQEIIIYVPEGTEFENVSIETGVGRVNIDILIAESVDLRLGVGEVRIEELISRRTTRIDGGVGRLRINSGEMRNLNLNSGVGETEITAALAGNSRLDTGVGRVGVNILGNMEDYTISTSTGVGRININGERRSSGTHGSGENNLDIRGGVGAVDVTIGE